ncbi:MAG: IS1634 family transposase [bacterium]
MKRSVQKSGTYEYLQIVESFRDAGRPRQRVIATLGRRDTVVASGTIDGLLRSLARTSRSWGPALVFGRLWKNQGLPDILRHLARGRKFGFQPEQVVFALALQRLCCPGSDLQGSGWVETVEADGFKQIALQHLYRATRFLAEIREELELELFERDRNLFTEELDLVFLDTTSVFVYRSEETEWRKRGYSRDRRRDLPQWVLAVAMDQKSWPVSWEIFPGHTADKKALEAMVKKMRERFRIRRVIVVADRGMMSRNTLLLLTGDKKAPYDYILGCRMRKQKEVREEVLGRAGRYEEVASNLKVKEVWIQDRRYIVCLNEEEARRDAERRRAILERLQDVLEKRGSKALVGNRGFSRYLSIDKGSVQIDEEAVVADARLDGKFVLRTNTELPAREVARAYKSLWRVERTFREEKSTLQVRPIFHHRDDTSIGHIVASFLALQLEVDLQRRLEEKKIDVSWPTLMRDLSQVHAVRVELDNHKYLLRTDLKGSGHYAFEVAGVRPPPRVTSLK